MKTQNLLLALGMVVLCGSSALATDNSTSASATNASEASNGNGTPLTVPARDYAGFTPPGAVLSTNRDEIRPGPNRSFGTRQSRDAIRSRIEVPPPANPVATPK